MVVTGGYAHRQCIQAMRRFWPIFNQEHQDRGWLEAIEAEGVNLTAWEETFIAKIATKIRAGRPLSEKKSEILEGIYMQRVP